MTLPQSSNFKAPQSLALSDSSSSGEESAASSEDDDDDDMDIAQLKGELLKKQQKLH